MKRIVISNLVTSGAAQLPSIIAGIADHPLAKKFPLGVTDEQKLKGFWG